MRYVLPVLTTLLGCVVAASYAGGVDPWLDLASHFRLMYFVVALVLVIVASTIWRRAHRLCCGILLAIAASQGAALASFYSRDEAIASTPLAPPSERVVRLLQFNVWGRNATPSRVVDLIAAERPDVATLQEVTWPILEVLEGRGYRIAATDVTRDEPAEKGCAIVVATRDDLRILGERRVRPFRWRGQTFLAVEVEFGSQRFELVCAHLPPPNHEKNRSKRPRYLAAFVDFLGAARGEVVFAGDLNTTPFSTEWSAILRDHVVSAADGFGYQPTWPVAGWRVPFRIPIDHVLVSRGLRVERFEVLENAAGSDHFPVRCDISFAPQRSEPAVDANSSR